MLSNTVLTDKKFNILKYNPLAGGTSLLWTELLSTSAGWVCLIMKIYGKQIRFWYKDKLIRSFMLDEYPGYSITIDGTVFSHRKGRPVTKGIRESIVNYKEGKPRKIQLNPKGYPIISCCNKNNRYTVVIHAWVALIFYGPRPDGLVVRHLDGDKLNFHYTNLKYGTDMENADDRKQHGTYLNGEKHINSKLTNEQATEIRKLRLTGKSVIYLAEIFNVGASTITDILQDKSYKCGQKTLLRKSENYTKRFKNAKS